MGEPVQPRAIRWHITADENPREGHLVVHGDLHVPEQQGSPIVEGLTQTATVVVIERVVNVETPDLGTEFGPDLVDDKLGHVPTSVPYDNVSIQISSHTTLLAERDVQL